MTDYGKLLEAVKSNVTFILVSILIVVCVYFIAKGLEKLIEAKCGMHFNSEKTKVNRLVVIAMFSAISAILMFFEFPLWFAPAFYELDFSEVPALVGAFMFGPTAGVAIEGLKVLIKIALKGTTTMFVGDLANFIVGCAMVVPASAFYFTKKNKEISTYRAHNRRTLYGYCRKSHEWILSSSKICRALWNAYRSACCDGNKS